LLHLRLIRGRGYSPAFRVLVPAWPGMLVLDIRGNARDGSVPEGVGVVEVITNITPASPSGGKEYVKLHLIEVKSATERTRFACNTKLFEAKA
jgi:hypothetical protein